MCVNPIQDGLFRSCSRIGGWGGAKWPPFPQICHTYPAMMKLDTVTSYLSKTEKVYELRDTPLSSPGIISIFSLEINNFCYIKKYRYSLHFDPSFLILLTFLESLKIAWINMVLILMISAKMATPSFLKIKVFWNTGYYVIISAHGITIKFYHWFKLYCKYGHVTKVW